MPISDSQCLSIYLLTRAKTYERKGFRNTSQSHNVWCGWPNDGPKFDQATRILFWCSESSIARDWTTSSGQREAKEGDNHRTWIACLLLNTAEWDAEDAMMVVVVLDGNYYWPWRRVHASVLCAAAGCPGGGQISLRLFYWGGQQHHRQQRLPSRHGRRVDGGQERDRDRDTERHGTRQCLLGRVGRGMVWGWAEGGRQKGRYTPLGSDQHSWFRMSQPGPIGCPHHHHHRHHQPHGMAYLLQSTHNRQHILHLISLHPELNWRRLGTLVYLWCVTRSHLLIYILCIWNTLSDSRFRSVEKNRIIIN